MDSTSHSPNYSYLNAFSKSTPTISGCFLQLEMLAFTVQMANTKGFRDHSVCCVWQLDTGLLLRARQAFQTKQKATVEVCQLVGGSCQPTALATNAETKQWLTVVHIQTLATFAVSISSLSDPQSQRMHHQLVTVAHQKLSTSTADHSVYRSTICANIIMSVLSNVIYLNISYSNTFQPQRARMSDLLLYTDISAQKQYSKKKLATTNVRWWCMYMYVCTVDQKLNNSCENFSWC